MRRRTLDPEALEPHLHRMLRAAAALTGVWDLAHDLVQATCLHVIRDPQKVRTDAVLKHCIATMYELFLDERRGRRRRVVADAPDGDELDLIRVLARLPPEQRDALMAVDVAGLSHADATELLGIRATELGMRLYRGRDRLARALEDAASDQVGDAPFA